ncbi:hypothetical protein Drose_20905 [Dactylosporangium roseum]|uniref:Secreted protein n=1 Tax=Dactylosporangium roseum TaxID=47989 RepID=A0ABY5YVI1_9ACTN|nr:hypothetical protein [Dactylosporangium roseum]UWZ33746.1 hypothetical protein Drose_20905 [Dactylosporangium roseum]
MTDAAGPPQAAKRRSPIGVIILVVVAVAVIAGIWYANRDQAMNAKAGDCLQQTGKDELKIVDCASADAQYTVLGKVGGKERIESTVSVTKVCDQWPETTATFWQGKEGEKGDVLCLKATK